MGGPTDDWTACRLGLDLLEAPWGVRIVRRQPLPPGVDALLNVAAGDTEREAAAAKALGCREETVRQAAGFFIEQILLAPDADSYRVLGATEAATAGELRRNMALMMRWLHPDVARGGVQSVFAARIAAAWNTLKTPERRAAYDTERQGLMTSRSSGATRPEASPRSGLRFGRKYRRSKVRRGRTGRLPRLLAYWLLGRPMHR